MKLLFLPILFILTHFLVFIFISCSYSPLITRPSCLPPQQQAKENMIWFPDTSDNTRYDTILYGPSEMTLLSRFGSFWYYRSFTSWL